MNIFRRKPIRLLTTIFSMLVSIAMLSACGGSGGGSDTTAGIGGTGIAVGKITDFGSIFVNGGIFNINQTQFLVDGEEKVGQAGQDALAIGMVVLVKTETNNGVLTGEALEVFYDDEVEGPIAAVPGITVSPDGTQKTFDIFDQIITIDETDTIFDGTSFNTISINDVVEISGFRVSPIAINATYVEWKEVLNLPGSEVELRGTIQNHNPVPPDSFEINGITINTDGMTQINVPGGLQNGLFVEVEGLIQTQAPTSILASEIEFEDEDLGDDVDDVSLQGIISNFNVGLQTFEIDGQAINFSGAQIEPSGATLENGLEVEVEGDIVGGGLIAEEVEVREGESKLETFVNPGSVDTINNFFEVFYPNLPGTVVINVDEQTLFKDESAIGDPDFTLAELMDNDFVKIEGQEVNNEVVASVVKRLDLSEADKLKLKGAVDVVAFLNWIEVLGIRYNVDGGTDYEDENGSLTGTQFFGLLMIGDLVEIEDDNDPIPTDGIADEVELE
jgi:hypothetical protein